MTISRDSFTWRSGWDDGEYSYDASVILENTSDQTVELVRTSCVLLSADGATVTGSFKDEDDAYMEPGDKTTVTVNTGYSVHGKAIDQDQSSVQAQIDLTMFRREFFNLGELDVPSGENEVSQLSTHTDVAGGALKILGATIRRKPEDDDGETTLDASVGLRNLGDGAVQKAVVKLILMDREGSQIDDREYDETIPPRSSVVIEPSVYTKTGRLRGAKVKLTVALYQPISKHDILLSQPTKED